MSAASADRPGGESDVDDGDEDISQPATAPLLGLDQYVGPVAGEDGSGQGEPPPSEPGEDDDEYEPL